MRTTCTLLFGALLSASAVTVVAADDTSRQAKPAQAESGLRAYVDPETGQLTSQPVTAEQKRASEAVDPTFRQDDEGLQIVYFEDGSSMMDLQGRFEQATVVEVQSDASLRTYCSDADHLRLGKHAHAPLATSPSAPSTREER